MNFNIKPITMSLSIFGIVLFVFFTGIGLYARMTQNPKPYVPDDSPGDEPVFKCTLSEALERAWRVYEDTQTRKHVTLSYNGVKCMLSPDFYRTSPSLLVSFFYENCRRPMPAVVLSHEDEDYPGIADIPYDYPGKRDRIAALIQETLAVPPESEQVEYTEMDL